MKTLLPKSIKTVNEAKAFLAALYFNGESFHPEDDARDISWELPARQKPTKGQAKQLNGLMDEIYNLDGNNGNHANPKFDPCAFLLELEALAKMERRKKINWTPSTNNDRVTFGKVGKTFLFEIERRGIRKPVFILKSYPPVNDVFTRGNNSKILGNCSSSEESQELAEIKLREYLRLFDPLNSDQKIIVEVRGGVAYCDDPRVEIIDHD